MTRSIMNPYADLSYDIFRRIIQFGKINETDATKLVRLVFYSEIYSWWVGAEKNQLKFGIFQS